MPLLFLILALVYTLYQGWVWYNFRNDPTSPYQAKFQELEKARQEEEQAKKNIQIAIAFKKTVEQKRVDIRNLNNELRGMQSSLNENINVPDVVTTLTNEAKKVNLKIMSFIPGKETHRELYDELPIELEFKGVFHQLVVFFERISTLSDIMKIGNFNIFAIGSGDERFVELKGKVQVSVYRYVRSEVDQETAPDSKKAPPAPGPNTARPPAGKGGA